MNGVNITLEQGAFIVKGNIYEFSHGFINFLTNPNVTYGDNIEEDENKIKSFLIDIRYDVGKCDKKSSIYIEQQKVYYWEKMVYSVGVQIASAMQVP